MSFRTTLVLLVLAAAMGAYVLIYERDDLPDPAKEKEVQVFDETFESKDILKLEISLKDSTVSLERSGDTKWTLGSPPGARADKMQVDTVATTLAGLRASRKLDNPESLAAFGLENPAAKISFVIQGKTAPRSLLLGEKTMDSVSVYAKREDAAAVFLIPAQLQAQIEKPGQDWRDRALAGLTYTDVQGVEVEREGGKLAFEKQGERWVMTEPVKIPASKDEVEALARDASGLRVEVYTKDGATPEDLKTYALDAPRYKVKMRVGPTAATQILFGASEASEPAPTPEAGQEPGVTPPATTRVYAKLADDSSVVLVPGALLERLGKRAEDFYFLQPFYTQQWQVQRAELRLENASLVLEKDAQGEWSVVEPADQTVDYTKASGLLSELFTLRFEALAPQGSTLEEKAKLVLTPEKKGDTEVPAETLLIGAAQPDGTRLVQRQGESWVYIMKDVDLGPLRSAIDGIINAAPPTPAVGGPGVAETPAAATP